MTQTSTNPTRVIIVDGHPVFAEALAIAIEATGELTCVGTADDIDAATGLVEAYQPDVAVLDVQLSGSEGVRLLLERHPRMRVLVLTGLPLNPPWSTKSRPPAPPACSPSRPVSASWWRRSPRWEGTPSPWTGRA